MVVTIARCGLACEVCQYFLNQSALVVKWKMNVIVDVSFLIVPKKRQIKYCLQCPEFPCGFMNLSKPTVLYFLNLEILVCLTKS